MDIEQAVRLRRAINRLARTFNASATDEDLTPTQASVLGLVATVGPLALAEVARIESLNPSMCSRVVGALCDRGLLSRQPDPNDLRTATLTATREGGTVHARIKKSRAEAIRQATKRLDARDHAALVAALPALEALAPPPD